MEVSTEKSKIMTNNMKISADITMNSQELEDASATSLKCLGATLYKDGTYSTSGSPQQW